MLPILKGCCFNNFVYCYRNKCEKIQKVVKYKDDI